MSDLTNPMHVLDRDATVRIRPEGTPVIADSLIHEALARSRQQEAERARVHCGPRSARVPSLRSADGASTAAPAG